MAAYGPMMLDALVPLYQDVANELVRVLPADWRRAFVQVEMDGDTGSIACFAAVAAAPKAVHVKLPVRVFDLFARMRQIAQRGDAGAVWTTATFVLEADGTFNVDYGYEPVPIEEQLDRRIAWKRRYGLT